MARLETARDSTPLTDPNAGGILDRGAMAGAIGGALMALFAIAHAGATGIGLATPFKLIAATFFASDALAGGTWVAFLGLLLHLTASISWGALFAAIAPRPFSVWSALPLGLLYGIAVWMGMTYLILPAVDPVLRESITGMSKFWFIEHLVFGLGVGLTPLVSRHWTKFAVVRYSRSSGNR